jgi:hypothetical protein
LQITHLAPLFLLPAAGATERRTLWQTTDSLQKGAGIFSGIADAIFKLASVTNGPVSPADATINTAKMTR